MTERKKLYKHPLFWMGVIFVLIVLFLLVYDHSHTLMMDPQQSVD